jgi:preprotein translocase subunit SecD
MKSRSGRFNIYLLAIGLAWFAGCKTPEEKRHDNMRAVLRFYLEATPDSASQHQTVEISGVELHAQKSHVVDEASVSRAALVSTRGGGYALEIEFDDHGKLVLDSLTASSKGRHLLIFSQFGLGKTVQDRWLAAPLITQRLSAGKIIFTPNATREEASDIALGLNNVAAERESKAWWR